jgi:hypothetical protein
LLKLVWFCLVFVLHDFYVSSQFWSQLVILCVKCVVFLLYFPQFLLQVKWWITTWVLDQ